MALRSGRIARLRRWIANPIATVALLAIVLVDSLTLPRMTDATTIGLVIRHIENRVRGRSTLTDYFVNDTQLFAVRENGSLRYIHPESQSWNELSAILAAGSPPVAQVYCIEDSSRRSGFWAHTHERYSREIRVIPLCGTWSAAGMENAKKGMFVQANVPVSAWPSVQQWNDIATTDYHETTLLWGGIAHDAFAIAVFVVLLYSFTGWPAWFGARPWSNAARRRRRGQCPACGYDLRGVDAGVCPECGGETEPRP
ncbi:MAG TPA: hypothetical protein VFF69_15200 [Phycisphaerales bacterium]|nr:hypothetical protein [Phycisphaerales bacterium]